MQVTENEKHSYDEQGYVIMRQVFSTQEIESLRDHYMALRAEGEKPGDFAGDHATAQDPLYKFPRMINMHHWDEASRNFLLNPRLRDILTDLAGVTPYAVQTMLYFKPPGARGQAVHQDNWYLRAAPGTCIGAWLALDDCDESNGCLQLVPGSNKWPLLCAIEADTTKSFTSNTVPLPENTELRPMIMKAGDVLFFHGSVVHGSLPNITQDRFRRSLIGHYVEADTEKLWKFYKPVWKWDGTEVTLEGSDEGGLCGNWVTRDGVPVIENSGVLGKVYKTLE
jgi:ectoine hydroxylase-related dioxygenase (phytanoyl-CoA dioxygenase family)